VAIRNCICFGHRQNGVVSLWLRSGHGSGFGFGFPNMVLFYTKYPHRIIPGIESRAGDKYAMDMDVDVG